MAKKRNIESASVFERSGIRAIRVQAIEVLLYNNGSKTFSPGRTPSKRCQHTNTRLHSFTWLFVYSIVDIKNDWVGVRLILYWKQIIIYASPNSPEPDAKFCLVLEHAVFQVQTQR